MPEVLASSPALVARSLALAPSNPEILARSLALVPSNPEILARRREVLARNPKRVASSATVLGRSSIVVASSSKVLARSKKRVASKSWLISLDMRPWASGEAFDSARTTLDAWRVRQTGTNGCKLPEIFCNRGEGSRVSPIEYSSNINKKRRA